MQGSPVSATEKGQGKTQTSGGTGQATVQKRNLKDASGDETSNSPQRNTEMIAEDDETHLITTHIGQPQTSNPNQDANFKSLYSTIRSLARTWVEDYFSDIPPEAKRSIDLLHLAQTSPQLMEYANWISVCGQKRTWEGVFTEQRGLLVFGILGKMLEVHGKYFRTPYFPSQTGS